MRSALMCTNPNFLQITDLQEHFFELAGIAVFIIRNFT